MPPVRPMTNLDRLTSFYEGVKSLKCFKSTKFHIICNVGNIIIYCCVDNSTQEKTKSDGARTFLNTLEKL